MSDIAIKVENLSKRYRIGDRQKQLTTLRERIEDLLSSPFDYLRSTIRGPYEEEIVWADEGLTRVKSRLDPFPLTPFRPTSVHLR